MKKILASVLSLVLLSACSSSTIKDNTLLYTINANNTYKQDFYDSMKQGDDGSVIINAARTDILSTLDIDTEAVEELVNKNISQLTEVFGDQVNSYILSIGFTSLEDFVEKQVKPSIILEIKAKEDLEAKGNALIEEYSIKKVEYLSTSKKDELVKYVEQVQNGTKMAEIELDPSTKYKSEMYSKSVEIPSESLKKHLDRKLEIGLSEILYDEQSNLYFVVNNIEITDENELINQVLAKENYIQTFSASLFKNEGFKVFDKDLLSKMKKKYPEYIK